MKYLGVYFITVNVLAQTDNVGSGRAIQFDGNSNYVSYGDIYHNVNLPFTVSAWVYLDPTSGLNPIFATNDNPLVYRGFIFFISPTAIGCEFGDGTGGNSPAYRRGKIANAQNVLGRWIHVCAVMTAPFIIDLYINGINVGGNSSGSSVLPMASSISGDIAKSGYYISNSVTYRFKGAMDEVRLWNRALTPAEVQQGMCIKLIGNEPDLIGNWNFDETSGSTVTDKSPNGFNGTLVNSPQRVYSGAPIGNSSKYVYSSNWVGASVTMTDGSDQVTASTILGNPEGIHIYEVKSIPSQTNGISAAQLVQPYFGVFVASLDADNRFDVAYNFSCLFSRNDNSMSTWTTTSSPAINILQQTEVIKNSGQIVSYSLGPDQILCNQVSLQLSTGLTDPALTYLWNNGMNTSSINISQSGLYFVKVSGYCGSVSDSVVVIFENPPIGFSFGSDQNLCKNQRLQLKPVIDTTNLNFLWQDGSKKSSYNVVSAGKYWVTVKNYCGQATDTINFVTKTLDETKLPNVITPNNDGKNDFYKIPEDLSGDLHLEIFNRWGRKVFQSSGYKNDWDGGDLDSGVYFLLLTGGCIERFKSTVTIIR